MEVLSRQGVLFCLVGPTGSGKSSLGSRLLADHPSDLKLSISVTSRQPREGEVDGTHYYFVDRTEFERKRDAGELFEWEETHGHYYGTLQSVVDDAVAGKGDLLLDVDIRGALTFRERYPGHTVITFLLPPDFSTLEARLRGRGSMSEEELQRRFRTATREYETLLEGWSRAEVDYLVVNDDFDHAYGQISAILSAERSRLSRFDREAVRAMCVVPKSL